jgi:hypothetical protein
MKMQLPRLNLRLLTVVAAMSLAACASGGTVSRVNIATSYLPEELYVAATGKHELRTIIVGEPFDMPKDKFDEVVLASLEGQNFGPRLNLSTDPKQEDPRKRQVVLAFNLTNIQQVDNLCSGTAETAKPADTGALTVTGVYCYGGGGSYLTQATARASGVTGPDTEQFRRLMTQLAISLFPDDNPHRRGDAESCLNC